MSQEPGFSAIAIFSTKLWVHLGDFCTREARAFIKSVLVKFGKCNGLISNHHFWSAKNELILDTSTGWLRSKKRTFWTPRFCWGEIWLFLNTNHPKGMSIWLSKLGSDALTVRLKNQTLFFWRNLQKSERCERIFGRWSPVTHATRAPVLAKLAWLIWSPYSREYVVLVHNLQYLVF